jgi:hypothetical protein
VEPAVGTSPGHPRAPTAVRTDGSRRALIYLGLMFNDNRTGYVVFLGLWRREPVPMHDRA